MKTDRTGIIKIVRDEYSAEPEYLWADTPEAAVFRHSSNRKWFGVILNVSGKRLGLDRDDIVDVLDVKCDPLLLGSMLEKPGCLPAYHMNKKHWLSVLLDGSVPEEDIRLLLDMSYDLTAPKPAYRKRKTQE